MFTRPNLLCFIVIILFVSACAFAGIGKMSFKNEASPDRLTWLGHQYKFENKLITLKIPDDGYHIRVSGQWFDDDALPFPYFSVMNVMYDQAKSSVGMSPTFRLGINMFNLNALEYVKNQKLILNEIGQLGEGLKKRKWYCYKNEGESNYYKKRKGFHFICVSQLSENQSILMYGTLDQIVRLSKDHISSREEMFWDILNSIQVEEYNRTPLSL